MLLKLIKYIAYVFIAAFIYLILKKYFGLEEKPIGKPSRAGFRKKGVTGNMVQDPVCGVFILEEQAEKKKIEDAWYYFCSEKCAEKFISGEAHSDSKEQKG
jgi:YHS domain-containing protein